ncbi:MAG: hypothetical protein IPM77_12700 [Crocinitomicaceae bacterium]|nr:hypothetical protein [Crocinitomicaceae bacterium]
MKKILILQTHLQLIKTFKPLNTIKTQKQGEINLNNDRIKQLDGGTTSSRPAMNIAAVMPDYDQKMAAIDQKNLDEKNELTEKNALNNQLISAIDSKIAQLENEKKSNPANSDAINKDIQTLQNIKSQKQGEVNANNERIKQLDGGVTATRSAITISSIMPDYDQKMAAIEKKNLDEKNELTEKNALNNQLISAIDSKIAQLENEKNQILQMQMRLIKTFKLYKISNLRNKERSMQTMNVSNNLTVV